MGAMLVDPGKILDPHRSQRLFERDELASHPPRYECPTPRRLRGSASHLFVPNHARQGLWRSPRLRKRRRRSLVGGQGRRGCCTSLLYSARGVPRSWWCLRHESGSTITVRLAGRRPRQRHPTAYVAHPWVSASRLNHLGTHLRFKRNQNKDRRDEEASQARIDGGHTIGKKYWQQYACGDQDDRW